MTPVPARTFAPILRPAASAALLAGVAVLTACAQVGAGSAAQPGSTTPAAVTPTPDAVTERATASYRRYVASETDALVVRTGQFVAAVRAGDSTRAKDLYPVARRHFERIEPVAASFGDLDPRIDGREDVTDDGREFTGFHRLEKDLWVDGLSTRSTQTADQLLADVTTLAAEAKKVEFEAIDLAEGSKGLLDEMATGKITGEEERYSHTDLHDFAANFEGALTAIDALRPIITAKDADLAARLDAREKELEAVLRQHARGRGWVLYTDLSKDEVKELSTALDAYGEVVAQVAGVVAT